MVPKKLRCSFEVRWGDSRHTQIVAIWDWLLPNTKVRYSTRSSAFESACGAKCLGTRAMCPEFTVADTETPQFVSTPVDGEVATDVDVMDTELVEVIPGPANLSCA